MSARVRLYYNVNFNIMSIKVKLIKYCYYGSVLGALFLHFKDNVMYTCHT